MVALSTLAAPLTGVLWHIWLGVLLTPLVVLTVIGLIAGYFFKVTRSKYPRG
jgi:hypothetical protein